MVLIIKKAVGGWQTIVPRLTPFLRRTYASDPTLISMYGKRYVLGLSRESRSRPGNCDSTRECDFPGINIPDHNQ